MKQIIKKRIKKLKVRCEHITELEDELFNGFDNHDERHKFFTIIGRHLNSQIKELENILNTSEKTEQSEVNKC